jgi:hypothetical protein
VEGGVEEEEGRDQRRGAGEGGGREQRREEQGKVDLTLGLGVTTAGGEEAALEARAAGRKLPGQEEAASRAASGWRSESGTRWCHRRRVAGGAQ